MVDPAGNPLPASPWGAPGAGATYAPHAQPPVAVPPPVAIPPQALRPDQAQFSAQAMQQQTVPPVAIAPAPAVVAPNAIAPAVSVAPHAAAVVPASHPQGYTQLWAETPVTDLWQTAWQTAPTVPVASPPLPAAPPVIVPAVILPPVSQPVPAPAVVPPVVAAPPAPAPEPPKPEQAPAPLGGLPPAPEPDVLPEPEPVPPKPEPPTQTAARLGGLPTAPEPEPPAPPTQTAARLGGLPTTPEPEPEVKSEPKAEPKPEPKPAPVAKPEPKPELANGRSWKVVADPHFTTGDGKQFDVAVSGRFTLLASADGLFEVQNTQGTIPGDRGVWNTAVTLKSHGDTVTYDAPTKTLTVNGKPLAVKAGTKQTLPNGGKLEIVNTEYAPGKFAPRVQVVTPEGDRVAVLVLQRKNGGRYVDLYGNIGAKRNSGEIKGLVGAFDADNRSDNDLLMRDGKVAPNLDAFLKDWRLS